MPGSHEIGKQIDKYKFERIQNDETKTTRRIMNWLDKLTINCFIIRATSKEIDENEDKTFNYFFHIGINYL